MNDKSIIVLGTAVYTLNQICPGFCFLIVDRFDLVHKHYRKLLNVLTQTDEWGQSEILYIYNFLI
jgi:hypothetical protein